MIKMFKQTVIVIILIKQLTRYIGDFEIFWLYCSSNAYWGKFEVAILDLLQTNVKTKPWKCL